jgi:hypothetical protein
VSAFDITQEERPGFHSDIDFLVTPNLGWAIWTPKWGIRAGTARLRSNDSEQDQVVRSDRMIVRKDHGGGVSGQRLLDDLPRVDARAAHRRPKQCYSARWSSAVSGFTPAGSGLIVSITIRQSPFGSRFQTRA